MVGYLRGEARRGEPSLASRINSVVEEASTRKRSDWVERDSTSARIRQSQPKMRVSQVGKGTNDAGRQREKKW